MTSLPSPNMTLIREVNISLKYNSLTLFLGNPWATGSFWLYDLTWPLVKEGIISYTLFALHRVEIQAPELCAGANRTITV